MHGHVYTQNTYLYEHVSLHMRAIQLRMYQISNSYTATWDTTKYRYEKLRYDEFTDDEADKDEDKDEEEEKEGEGGGLQGVFDLLRPEEDAEVAEQRKLEEQQRLMKQKERAQSIVKMEQRRLTKLVRKMVSSGQKLDLFKVVNQMKGENMLPSQKGKELTPD